MSEQFPDHPSFADYPPPSASDRLVDVPPPPAGPPVKKTERPHPLTPLIRGWIILIALVLTVGREFLPGGQSGERSLPPVQWIVLGIIAIVVLAALAGLASWYFTKYVLDDEELRIETGFLNRNSKRIPFVKIQSVDLIQPLAARLLGLCEVRIEVGRGGDSGAKLRYLTHAKATQMRDYLITRAHGEQISVADSAGTLGASRLTDLAATDRKIITIAPDRLVLGFVLSTDFIVPAIFLVASLVVTMALGAGFFALPIVLPLTIGLVTMISRRVLAQFNYTLAEAGKGLRITRGLTNLTSQSVPVDRIQGVRISQSILWRKFGWSRVEIDVLGYGGGGSEDGTSSSASNLLLPVADKAQVQVALARILPGVEIDGIDMHPSPRNARFIRWFDFWTLAWGVDERVIAVRRGWLTRTIELVPHTKTQSVRLTQGPVQRRLKLASVHVDNTPGPVDMVAVHLSLDTARGLAMSQLGRAENARALPVPPVPQTPPEVVAQTLEDERADHHEETVGERAHDSVDESSRGL